MKKNILVLYSDNPSRLAHINKINSLRKHYSFTLILDKKDFKEWLSKFVDNIITIEMNRSLLDIEDIVKKIEKIGKPDGILNLSELCVPLHSALATIFNLPGMKSDKALIARNKYLMRQFSKELEIPIPKFILVDDKFEEKVKELTFPIILKPTIGGGSGIVRRFETLSELLEKKEEFLSLGVMYSKDPLFNEHLNHNNLLFLAEEIIGGEILYPSLLPYKIGEISVESIFFDNQTHILAIHDKNIPNNGPYFEEYMWSTPSRIPQNLIEKAFKYVDKIHRNLGSYVLHTEFRTFKDELILIEFGARLGGGPIYSSVLTSTTNDYIEILIDLSLGERPKLKKGISYPTLTHCLWAQKQGKLKNISGLSKGVFRPFYYDIQIYDDIGDLLLRAPKSTRANGHIVFKNDLDNDFEKLETSVMEAIETIKFNIEE